MQGRSFPQRKLWQALLPPTVVWGVLWVVTTLMCCAYERMYDREYGWTKLINFGAAFAPASLPRLKTTTHYVDPAPFNRSGYDGQFYAQIALDPSLRDPAFDRALDLPAYRGRRIGLPALSFLLGGGKPRWILQIYAVSNLFFWFALTLVLQRLLRPLSTQSLLCLLAASFGFGVVASMNSALTDLPAATLIFGALLAANFSGGAAFLSAAVLTRETSALAAVASAEWRRPTRLTLRRDASRLALALLPFLLWMVYLRFRFGPSSNSGEGNFAWPLSGFAQRAIRAWREIGQDPILGDLWQHWNWGSLADEHSVFHLVYDSRLFHELLLLLAVFAQGIYLLIRPNPSSVVWRIGVSHLVLGCLLGEAVWDSGRNYARVLLPMSIAFYLLLASERRPAVFWPFFLVTALAIPYGFYELLELCGG